MISFPFWVGQLFLVFAWILYIRDDRLHKKKRQVVFMHIFSKLLRKIFKIVVNIYS